jgi:hypothetical protein
VTASPRRICRNTGPRWIATTCGYRPNVVYDEQAAARGERCSQTRGTVVDRAEFRALSTEPLKQRNLQRDEILADTTSVQIIVCHFPPSTSKWNLNTGSSRS